jgi:two-component system, chemotaxis family, sensor histidine kinase and response regulator WspE
VSGDLSGFSMLELFRMEAETQTTTLSVGLVALEGASATPETIEPLMRAAHSLKGAARIVGLDAAVRIAHAMEDCFVAAQKGKLVLQPQHVDVLLRGVDMLVQISQSGEQDIDGWQSSHGAEVEVLVADLTAVKQDQLPAPVAPAAPQPACAKNASALPLIVDVKSEPASPVGEGRASERAIVEVDPGRIPVGPTEPKQHGSATTGEKRVGERSVAEPTVRDGDRVVRVSAESLTRLMGLAGEALVQTYRLRPLVDSLWRLEGRQTGLLESLQVLEDRLASKGAVLPAAERELLSKAKGQAVQNLQGLHQTVESMEEFTRGSEDVSSRLHHEVLNSRMRPLGDGIRSFPRLVRDLARELGKQARFEVVGEATGVDRDILDRLEAPLTHLIRNALDHGIESPEDRLTAGKVSTGTIRLEARHRAGMLQILLDDDGRGIDLEGLRAEVVKRGLTTPEIAQRLTESELLDFLFLPAFSTKTQVTEVSGRGVGLDVVKSMVQTVRGSVRVTSRFGKGTRFVLQLPITVSVVRALLVEIAGEPYAFPLNRIDRLFMLDPQEVHELEGKSHAVLDEQPIGLIEASKVLDVAGHNGHRGKELIPVVVASDHSHRFGVVVDRVLGERDLRVSPLDARLGKVPNINSCSVLENDWPVLIIDVEDLIRSIDNLLSGRRLGRLETGPVERRVVAPKRVLVVDDSITVRELERQLLESRGYAVDTAVDGVDGWNAVRSAHYDLVVSDIDMPRMDGIQLVKHIKEDSRLQAIPVVVVSYKDREEDRLRGLDAGANSYLTKSSFHDQTFLNTVADLIGEARE